jgi:hypothetical protein
VLAERTTASADEHAQPLGRILIDGAIWCTWTITMREFTKRAVTMILRMSKEFVWRGPISIFIANRPSSPIDFGQPSHTQRVFNPTTLKHKRSHTNV